MDLSQKVLGILSDTDKQEFEIWQELLASRGYALLVDFLTDQTKGVDNDINWATSWDQYVHARGQRAGLNLVFELETLLAQKLQSIEEEAEAIAAEAEASNSFEDLEVNLGLSEDDSA